MEKLICNSRRGGAKTCSFVRVVALALVVATGAAFPAWAANRATWTGAAGNGLFQDSGNWTCFNESDEQIVDGIPAADTAITLAADVPANGWADADFSTMSGPIDLAGHSLTVPGAFFSVTPAASTNVIVNGDFEADEVEDGGFLSVAPQGWTRSHSNIILIRNNTSYTFNNNKTDNGCFLPGNNTRRSISQTFTLPEDAILSLSFNHINRNSSKGYFYQSPGNVKIDGTEILSFSETGWGLKSKSATLALAAGSHTIKFTSDTSFTNYGLTFDNIKLTYQPSARTVTDSVGGGSLHVNVLEGETVSNTDVSMTGHLKLVKEGAGTFISQRRTLPYDGGTEVVAGTLATSEGVGTDPITSRTFGALGNVITVLAGGTLQNAAGGYDFPNYNVVLDGGTLAASAAGTIVETNGTCSVSVGTNGGTIDNGGFAVTVAADIAGAGSLALVGTGTTTLSVDQTASGALNVGAGTLALSGGVSVARPTTIPDGATLTVPGTETVTFGSLTLAGGSTLDLAAYVGGVTPLAATTLNLPAEGTVGLTLCESAFDSGLYAIYANAGVSSGDGLKFVPSAGDLECTWSVDDGTLFLTTGTPDPRVWTGLVGDGNLSTPGNWYGGAVPNDVAIIKCVSPETLTVGTTFAPDAILFPLGCAELVIEGDGISGISAITNLSASTQTFTAPVTFADKILVIQNAVDWSTRAQSSVRFAGGVTGTDFAEGTARYLNGAYTLTAAENWIANTQGHNDRWGIPEDSSLTLPFSSNTSEIALGEHSTIAGGAFTAAVVRTSARICCWNLGEYVVTGELAVTLPNATRHIAYRGSDGAFKFEKVTLGETGTGNKLFYFANEGNYYYDKNIWIGAGGLNFAEGTSANTAYACGRRDNDVIRVHPWHSDYAIGTKAGSTRDIEIVKSTHFGTTDENGVARTVTCNGIVSGSAAVSIEGAGRFVVNNVNTASSAVTVKDTATLAINAGKKMTTGTLTVNSGATLEVAESGTVTLGGNLTLASGANLAFNFTNGRTPPVLGIADGKTVTANGAVTVKISADGVCPGSRKVLTTCGGFEGATVTLAEDAPDWAKGRLTVSDDGNIVLDILPKGTVISVR